MHSAKLIDAIAGRAADLEGTEAPLVAVPPEGDARHAQEIARFFLGGGGALFEREHPRARGPLHRHAGRGVVMGRLVVGRH